jgi:hypothetical protein
MCHKVISTSVMFIVDCFINTSGTKDKVEGLRFGIDPLVALMVGVAMVPFRKYWLVEIRFRTAIFRCI